jgi:hypothetical protein
MTGDDLKRLQDHFIEGSKRILLETGRLRPVGFVVTLHKHVDKLFESGWGVEFLGRQADPTPSDGDGTSLLIVDLMMSWEKLYHAILTVFPKTRDVLPKFLALGREIEVDDPYKRVVQPFLTATKLDEKDIMTAVMRQICDKVDAYASLFHSEAWLRMVRPDDHATIAEARAKGLSGDLKAVEVLMSSMETYGFTRMITTPIQREPSAKGRDDGKIVGFGHATESIDSPSDNHVIEGRLMRFLKPLKEAS